MPTGGARGRSGPAPDPNALRRNRPDDQAGWVTLPAARLAPAPEWPLLPTMTPHETTHWTAVWATPQATQWEALGLEVEVALYVRTLAEAQLPGAPVGLRKEARMMQENLGLSLQGLLRNRWKIAARATEIPGAASTAATANTPRPARTTPSARDRFRVVKPPEE